MFGGSQGHSPAYERAHAGSDLLTLVSYLFGHTKNRTTAYAVDPVLLFSLR